MNGRVLRIAGILIAVLLMLPSPGASQEKGEASGPWAERTRAQQTCTDWNLASDFRRWPNQENPNRDSCGNLGVWHFMESSGLNHDPATYSLLPYFANSSSGIQGLEKWTGSGKNPPPDGLPEGLINRTGTTHNPGYPIPPDVIKAHPQNERLAVVGWRSPISGSVGIAGSVKDLNDAYGDGILWFIDKGNADLASGLIPNGGRQDFDDGAGGVNLAQVYVNQGDFIYFAFHPNAWEDCDGTQLDISIHRLAYSVSGTVTSVRGTPMPGVTISADGIPRVVTDVNGSYTLDLYSGTHTITAASRCLAFSPPARVVTVPPDTANQDFTGWSACAYLPLTVKSWPPLPGAPVLNPITATGFDSHEVTWNTPANAVSYNLQEDANTSFSTPTTAYSGSSTVWQAQGKPAGDYCYRVQASNQYGNSSWSNARCITLAQRQDDFNKPNSGWPVESDDIALVGYESGEYRILAKQPEYVIMAGPGLSVTDFRCQVDARNAAHINGTYGIAFAASDTGYYLYEVGFGQFRLQRYERWGDKWTTLIPEQQHSAIHQGNQSNRLAVVRRSATITLYVNDTQVGKVADGVLGGGYVELAATGLSANYDARFDNFLLAYVGGQTQTVGKGVRTVLAVDSREPK